LKNVGIRSLRISGSDEGSPTNELPPEHLGVLVAFDSVSGCSVIDCHVDTHPIEGLYWSGAQSCENVLISGNRVTRVGGWSHHSWHGSAYNVNARNATMTNNWAFEVGSAIEQTGSGIFANNTFEYCGMVDKLGVRQWSVAMEMESTAALGRVVVTGNVIRYAATALSFSSSDGEVLIADNMIESCIKGIDANTSTEHDILPGDANHTRFTVSHRNISFVIRGNYLYGALESGSPAINHGGMFSQKNVATAPCIIEGNLIFAGTTPWSYAIHVNSAADIVRNNTVIGHAAYTLFFVENEPEPVPGEAPAYSLQFIDNIVIPDAFPPFAPAPEPLPAGVPDDVPEVLPYPVGPDSVPSLPSAAPRYRWRGVDYSKDTFDGIDNGTVLSTARPCVIRHHAKPASGRWSVGDTVINSGPTIVAPGPAQYVVDAWVCVEAGEPGVWVERRITVA
jgi:hypothetical protein